MRRRNHVCAGRCRDGHSRLVRLPDAAQAAMRPRVGRASAVAVQCAVEPKKILMMGAYRRAWVPDSGPPLLGRQHQEISCQ